MTSIIFIWAAFAALYLVWYVFRYMAELFNLYSNDESDSYD